MISSASFGSLYFGDASLSLGSYSSTPLTTHDVFTNLQQVKEKYDTVLLKQEILKLGINYGGVVKKLLKEVNRINKEYANNKKKFAKVQQMINNLSTIGIVFEQFAVSNLPTKKVLRQN